MKISQALKQLSGRSQLRINYVCTLMNSDDSDFCGIFIVTYLNASFKLLLSKLDDALNARFMQNFAVANKRKQRSTGNKGQLNHTRDFREWWR